MALILKNNVAYGGPLELPGRPPIPDDALGYSDFISGLHMTQAAVSTSPAAALCMSAADTAETGFYYGRDNIGYAPANSFGRVEYGADGQCLGLLVEGSYEQLIVAGQRAILSAGTVVGAAIAASGAAAEAWQQWYSLTPSGATEASLVLATAATTAAYLWVCWDVRGAGIVQVGAKSDTTGAYATFDLISGECWGTTGTVPAMVRRPGGGWTVVARIPVPSGGVSDAQPYIASVAAIDTARLGAAGRAVELRAPRVIASPGLEYAPPNPWGAADAASRSAADNPSIATTLLPLAADFTIAMRLRSGWYPQRYYQGIFIFGPTSGYAEVRTDMAGNFVLIDSSVSSTVPIFRWAARWEPDQVYRVAVSRRGQDIGICINGETAALTLALPLTNVRPRLARANNSTRMSWGGHLQRVIVWADAKPRSQLAVLCDRWL